MAIDRPNHGYSGQLFVAEEASYGTFTTAAAVKLRFPLTAPDGKEDKGLSPQRFFDGTNSRNMPTPQLSTLDYSGSFSQWLSDGFFLKMAFGAAESTTGNGAAGYTHTITESTVVPSFSFTDEVAGSGFSRQYEGCKVGRWTLRASEGGEAVESVDFTAENMRLATTMLTASAPDVEPFRFHQLVVKMNNAATTVAEVFENVNSIEVSVDNDLEGKRYLTDTGDARCINALHERGRNHTSIINIDFTSRKQYDAFFTGTTALETSTVMQGTTLFDFDFDLTLTRSATTTKDSINLTYNGAILTSPGLSKDVGNIPITLAMAVTPLALSSAYIMNSDATPWS